MNSLRCLVECGEGGPTDTGDGLRWRFRSSDDFIVNSVSYCNYLSYEALYRKLSGILKLPPRSFLLNNLYNFVECFITEIIVITYRSHDIIVTWNSGEFNPSPRQAYQYIYIVIDICRLVKTNIMPLKWPLIIPITLSRVHTKQYESITWWGTLLVLNNIILSVVSL